MWRDGEERKAGVALFVLLLALLPTGLAAQETVPASWTVLPVPRYADYKPDNVFLPVKKVAIVRRPGSAYQTVRTAQGELAPGSSIIEEELASILREFRVTAQSVPDTIEACAPFDTLILLGRPDGNAVTADCFNRFGLSFDRWQDPRTPEETFTGWPSLGQEGYVLKTGDLDGKTVIILAGYDFDDIRKKQHCAGTFYALQSFRQLLVKEGDALNVKTAEILDKPLLAVRGCYSGFDPDEQQQWRDIAFMAQIKANQNIYWYGNSLAGYNGESASRFRYPWKPEQLAAFQRIGKYCREHFVTMVFCMNPDHFSVEWATAKSFDGSRKDPLHYNPEHPVEPEIRELWKALGFEVEHDVDVLAAKFRQLSDAVPGALLQVMNEDDVFGLVHEDDKRIFNTATGDPVQDAVNYGRARGQFLVALHTRIKELVPDYPGLMPVCPPGQVCYQFALEQNAQQEQAFMHSLAATIGEAGLRDSLTIITTGGGTAAEVVAGKQIADFRQWSGATLPILHDNNFPQGFHVGAYEPNATGPRFAWQHNPEFASGYRETRLYKQLLGIHWNGLNDQHALGWCQAQFMWNMAALEREPLNAFATRKVSSAESYSPVKTLYEEFDNAACYLPDNHPPLHVLVVSDRIAFPGREQNGWQYDIRYTDAMRKEAQRYRDLWAGLRPRLRELWDSPERAASTKYLGDRAGAFCAVYLAYGYLQGWENATAESLLEGDALRDLLLEAEDIQGRYFAGPDESPEKCFADRGTYTSALHFFYTDGKMEASPESPSTASRYMDVWERGLGEKFYTPVQTIVPSSLPDGNGQLSGAWGPPQGTDNESYRLLNKEGSISLEQPMQGPLLLRVKLASESDALTTRVPVVLEAGGVALHEVVCKSRWIYCQIPSQVSLKGVTIRAELPIRVHAVEVYQGRNQT